MLRPSSRPQVPAAIPAAPNRRVASNQTSSGQRNIFSESATARAPPATHRLSRHRQAIAARSSNTGVNVPRRTEVITGRAVTTIARTRQSRTPRSHTAPMIDAMRSRPQTAAATPKLSAPNGASATAAPAGYGKRKTSWIRVGPNSLPAALTLSTFGYGETPLTTSLPPCQNWRKSKAQSVGPFTTIVNHQYATSVRTTASATTPLDRLHALQRPSAPTRPPPVSGKTRISTESRSSTGTGRPLSSR